MIFTEFSPRTPESDSMTMLRMFCEKFHSTAKRFLCKSRSISSVSSSLVRGRERPGGTGHCQCGFSGRKNSAL